MNDMSLAQFAEANADRITGDDLIGGPRTIKIIGVEGAVEEGKKRAIIHYEGEEPGKPFKPCKTMVRVMMAIWGEYASAFIGKSLTIYRDPAVTFGALATGGVRISHMSDMSEPVTVVVAAKKGKKGPITIKPLTIEKPKVEDRARGWADLFLRNVTEAPDAETLDKLEQAKRLNEVKTARPELHTECMHALGMRREALAMQIEGKPDADMGEGFASDTETGEF